MATASPKPGVNAGVNWEKEDKKDNDLSVDYVLRY
jgi:hypothetical protein